MNSTSHKAPRDLPRFVRDLLASPPGRGDGLNVWFYRMARLLHPFRTAAEIEELLAAATAGQPIKHGEIERAVKRSAATAWQPGQRRLSAPAPIWPPVNAEQREAIIVNGSGVVDLWEISPIRFADSARHAVEVVNTLFPGNPLLCCAWSNYRFDTRPKNEWHELLDGLQFIVPNPMSKPKGLTQECRESAHALSNTGPRRFLVVEFDKGTVDEHAATLLHLASRAPLALVVHSGHKSLHGWFYCANQPDQVLRLFMHYAVSLGADRATWTASQFVRMPDGRRADGSRQSILFFNPGVIR